MAPLTIGTAAMTATRTYSRSSRGPPGTNSALLNTAWMSSGLTMPIVEVSTMSPTTTATRPRYGLNSGITRRAVFRPTCAGGLALASAAGAASGPRVVIRPLSHPRHEHDPAEHPAGPPTARPSGDPATRTSAAAPAPQPPRGHRCRPGISTLWHTGYPSTYPVAHAARPHPRRDQVNYVRRELPPRRVRRGA